MADLKVLQVNKLYHPWIGGVEQVVQNVAEGLAGQVDMRVVACRPSGLGRRESINGVPVIKASSLGVFWGLPLSPSFPFTLYREARGRDVLHFHLPFPLGVMSYLLIPVKRSKLVVTYHSDIVRQQKLMRLYRPFLNKFLGLAEVIMPTSPNLLQNSPYLQPHREKCEVVPLSIDLEEFTSKNSGGETAFGSDSDRKRILFVGRLSYYKGLDVLLEAMQKVDARLLVVGEGELGKELRARSQRLSLGYKVEFLGKVSDRKLKDCYRFADVFVLPSVAKSEAFGLVQLEAMASGLPVVNTELPTGVPYVSKHGETGFTVPPGDPESLAEVLNELVEDEALARKFGENGKERVREKFTREKMLQSILDIYKHG